VKTLKFTLYICYERENVTLSENIIRISMI